MRYEWKEYAGRIPVAFLNCQDQAERLRKALALLDDELVQFLINNGLQFALCGERHTPSLTLTRWYPYEADAWARRYFGTSYDEAWGWYDERERTVLITTRHTVETVIHEVGHAVDMLLGDLSPHFFRPGYGVTPYSETDPREFWAESFERWFCPWGDRDAVARAHPDFPRIFNSLGEIAGDKSDPSSRLS